MSEAAPIDYTLIRSRRRTVALEVTADGAVLVRAPLRFPDREARRLVQEKEAWIREHIRRQRCRREAHPEPSPEQLAQWREQAKAVIPQRVAYYSRLMGLVPTGIRITAARTRFGSCSSQNSLSFSCRLMQYPPQAVDYVVVHELAHIRHHDHSPAFYALIGQYLPDHEARRALLK